MEKANQSNIQEVRKLLVVLALKIIQYSTACAESQSNSYVWYIDKFYLDAVYKLIPRITAILEWQYIEQNEELNFNESIGKEINRRMVEFLKSEVGYRYYSAPYRKMEFKVFPGYIVAFQSSKIINNGVSQITISLVNKTTHIAYEKVKYDESLHGDLLKIYENFISQINPCSVQPPATK